MGKISDSEIQLTVSRGRSCLVKVAMSILGFRARLSLGSVSAAELFEDLLFFSFRIAGVLSLRRNHDACRDFLAHQFDRVTELMIGDRTFKWGDLVQISKVVGQRVPTVCRRGGASSLLSLLPSELNELEDEICEDLIDWLTQLSNHGHQERGQIYERFLSYELGWENGVLGLRTFTGGSRKQKGIYYTPERLVQFAIERSMEAQTSCNVSLSNVTLCDPACGSGQFLIHCAEVFVERLGDEYGPEEATSIVIGRCLYGVDLDPIAVENTRFALLERASNPDDIWGLVWSHVRQGDTLSDIASIFGVRSPNTGKVRIDWHRDFSEVFDEQGDGGFDFIIGNPPWDKIEVLARERRDCLIDLDGEVSCLDSEAHWRDYVDNLRRFVKGSGIFPLSSQGRINTYCAFLECSLRLLSADGVCTMIVPTGMVTDYSTSRFVRSIIERKQLHSVYDFDNRAGFFDGVQGNVQFCVLTIGKRSRDDEYFWTASRLRGTELKNQVFGLTAAEVRRFNPETGTIPIFSTKTAMDIVSIIYRNALTIAQSPWFLSLKQGHFNMTTGKRVFIRSLVDFEPGVPLYEAKLCHQYEHRAATFEGVDASRAYGVHPQTNRPTRSQLDDPAYEISPRYRVPENVWQKRSDGRRWYLVYRNTVSTVADSRSCVASILPAAPIGNSLSFFNTMCSAKEEALILACLNSLVVDYALREKTSGSNLNFYVMRQLPILNLAVDDSNSLWSRHPKLAAWLCESVVRLVYSSHALSPFARACEYFGPPVNLTVSERVELKAEIDGLLCVLFGLSADDVDIVLASFETLNRVEERTFGTQMTATHVRDSFQRFSKAVVIR